MAETSAETRVVAVGPKRLEGILRDPEGAIGLVIFAHGAGSSRLSPRNNYVAERLRARGIATLLFDLLTEGEALDRANVFDIPLLSGRMIDAVRWARGEPELSGLSIGLFGASTGAAAALIAAAQRPQAVAAVVSRGGRCDLAGPALAGVEAPTLQIVGGEDPLVLELNRDASQQLRCAQHLAVVAGASHLFEEPGALEEVARLAGDWFERQLLAKPEQ